MRRMMLLVAFCALGVLTFVSAATAQQNPACSELGDSGEQAQQEARVILNQAPSAPNGLDADGDGIPCEFNESSGKISYEDGSVIFVTPATPPQDTGYPQVGEDGSVSLSSDVGTDCRSFAIAVEQGYDQGLTQGEIQNVLDQCNSLGYPPSGTQPAPGSGGNDVSELPETGGPSGLVLLGGALLLGSGLVVRRIVR